MLHELEEMSLMFDFLPCAEAERVIKEVTRKLAKTLRAQIVDVLWRKEAIEGEIILEPFAWFVDSQCSRGNPKPYQIPKHLNDDQKTGLWTYVYSLRQEVWIEDIIGADKSKPMINKAGSKEIDAKYLFIYGETNTFMATPLFVDDVVYGVFCVELPSPHKLTEDALKLMRRLARPISTIIWKAKAHETNDEHTRLAIDHYLDSIQSSYLDEFLTHYRSGFIARSFDHEFAIVQDYIVQAMAKYKIRAEHAKTGAGNVIDSMQRQIRSSHFGIVDITGNNPNVMIELGMMKILGKKVLLLRRKGDSTQIPFNIYNEHYYSYNVKQDGDIEIWSAGDNQATTFDNVIYSFISDLFNDPRFSRANPWNPELKNESRP